MHLKRGASDVYKPFGQNIFRYDVNSLYPFIMRDFKMPIGNVAYFEGDILKILPKTKGFSNPSNWTGHERYSNSQKM